MNKKKLNIFLLVFFTCVLVFSCTLVFLTFTTSEVKAESLDSNSSIQVGFPFYAGKDSLISPNCGDLPYFDTPVKVTNNYTFSNGNAFTTSVAPVGNTYPGFYTTNIDYKGIRYTTFTSNVIIPEDNTYDYQYRLKWNFDFIANTTYTFSFILFSDIGNHNRFCNSWLGAPSGSSYGSLSLFTINNGVIPSTTSFSRPYLFYITFTPNSNYDHMYIQFFHNIRACFFLLEGTSPTYLPPNNTRKIFNLNVPSFTYSNDTTYTFMNNTSTSYNSVLTINDESSFSDLRNALSRGSLSAYIKWNYISTVFVPLSYSSTSTGYRLFGRYQLSSPTASFNAYIDFELLVSTDTIFNIKFYRSDNQQESISLNSVQLFVNYFLDTYSTNLSYNSGFLDGVNSLSDTIIDLNDTISSQRTQLQALNDLIETNSDYSFFNLFSSIFDAPVKTAKGLLNFNVFGMDMYAFFTALLTLTLILFVWRVFIKGG